MGQSGIATHSDAAIGTLLPVFALSGQVPEALRGYPAATVAGETVLLTELTCEGRTFLFNHPLSVQVLQEDGGCSCESEDYNLLAYGRSRQEAETSFRHVFLHYWDKIACAGDEKLTDGAVALKRALRALVKSQK
jgi:hypothetical protein